MNKFSFEALLKSNDIFNLTENDEEMLYTVTEKLKQLIFLPEAIVISQGSYPTHLYFVARGCLAVTVNDHLHREVLCNEMTTGDVFGEIGILNNVPRTCSVFAKTFTIL